MQRKKLFSIGHFKRNLNRQIKQISLFLLIGTLVFSCTSENNPTTQDVQDTAIEVKETKDSILTAPPIEKLAQETLDTIKYTINKAGYIELTWDHLAEVDFEERYTEEVETYVPYPVFRPSVQRLSQQKVEIKGYIIPVEETGEESIIVLSANPFSSCFFCGMAGPETIMDIKLKKKFKNKFKQDDVLTFRGQLRLNDSDLYYLNYILEEAELVQ